MQLKLAIPKESYLDELYILQKLRADLQNELSEVNAKFEALVQQCEEENVKESDILYLTCKVRSVRTVDVQSFKEHFPTAYQVIRQKRAAALRQQLDNLVESDMQSISTREAEELVGRIPLHPVCTLTNYKTYVVEPKMEIVRE